MEGFFFALSLISMLSLPAIFIAAIIVCIVKKKISLFVIAVPINFFVLIISLFLYGTFVDEGTTQQDKPNYIVGAENNESTGNEQEETQTEIEKEEAEEEKEEQEEVVGFEYDGIKVVFKECVVVGGEDIYIYFEMTNNSDDDVTFDYTFSVNAWQGGVEIDQNFFYDCEEEENASRSIRPGTTITIAEVFELRNDVDEVEIEISPFITFTNEVLCEFTIEME